MLNHLENLPRILKPVHKSKKRLNHVQPWKEVSKKSQTTAKANYLQKKSKALKNTMGVYTLKTSNFCGDETIPAIYPSYGVKFPRLQCTGLLSGRLRRRPRWQRRPHRRGGGGRLLVCGRQRRPGLDFREGRFKGLLGWELVVVPGEFGSSSIKPHKTMDFTSKAEDV